MLEPVRSTEVTFAAPGAWPTWLASDLFVAGALTLWLVCVLLALWCFARRRRSARR